MSLFSAMRVSVAGFRAQAKRMSTIADNVSNSDTMGYKARSIAFTPQINCRGGGGSSVK
ncbi:MAG: flagellar basal body protein [Holosporales bacterium]|jgi:flagellar hook protein FlgE|nr:flagellar basal body protein [Holosporales bacterium]